MENNQASGNIVAKFEVGDEVEIINYGSKHLITYDMRCAAEYFDTEMYNYLLGKNTKPNYESIDKETSVVDLNPEYIGKRVVIDKVSTVGGRPTYAARGLNKHAWWNEDQFKLIYRPSYGK